MSKYKINKGFIAQKLGKKTVIFDAEKSLLYTFNQTASFAFNKIKKNWSKNQIAESLAKKYKISIDKAIADVKDLVDDLISKKIISDNN